LGTSSGYVAIYTPQIQRYRVNIPKVALPTYKKPLNVISLAILGIAIGILEILEVLVLADIRNVGIRCHLYTPNTAL